MLPHVNWGDLFFDLFYVAGAYNLGNILLNSPTFEGLLYFCGAFFAIMWMWLDKMFFDSRFAIEDDLWHRIFEVANLTCVATAILHIRPVDVFSDIENSVSMFAFTLSLCTFTIISGFRYLEVMLWGVGERPLLKYVGRRDLTFRIIPFVVYASACIYAGVHYFGDNDDGTKEDDHHDDHRFMAEAKEDSYYYSSSGLTERQKNIPIWLVLSGPFFYSTMMYIVYIHFIPKDFKSITIPMNIDFSIHRYGEWTMLMLGESILSLLIVEVTEERDYYITFFAGIMSVILLQYLHFRSQPHHADGHAMRRDRKAGFLFTTMQQFYSASLVVVGVSYKMFLYEYTYAEDSHRRLTDAFGRELAGGGASQFDTEDRRQRTANLFTGAMCVAWVSSDIMLLAHRGINDSVNRCYCEAGRSVKKMRVLLIVLRIGLILFMGSIGKVDTDPVKVVFAGMAAIIGQVALRVLGDTVFPKEKVHVIGSDGKEMEEEDEPWPNVTHARVVSSEKQDP